MKHPYASLTGRVIVITGASSGIGRAAAHAFALEGAHVVLAARRERLLQTVAGECERLGVRTLALRADVTDADALARVAAAAVNAFGRIDVWINNAGVGLFGAFAGADLKSHRRVVETNLFGTMHGAAAALPVFLKQGHGILITNVSIGGWLPVPFAAAYTASKFGMRGFLASLRQELAHLPAVRICSVFPATIDTPGYQHAANVSGVQLRPSRPLFTAEEVARAFVSLALHPRDEVAVGWPSRLARLAYAAAPSAAQQGAGYVFRRYLRQGKPAARATGNLFIPITSGRGTSGGWKKEPPRIRDHDRSAAVGWGLLALGLGLAGAGIYTRRQTRRHAGPLAPVPA